MLPAHLYSDGVRSLAGHDYGTFKAGVGFYGRPLPHLGFETVYNFGWPATRLDYASIQPNYEMAALLRTSVASSLAVLPQLRHLWDWKYNISIFLTGHIVPNDF